MSFTNQMRHGTDWVLGFGTRLAETDLSSWYKDFTSRMPPTKLVQIDIGPKQIGCNYPIEVEAVADLKPTLITLLETAQGLYPREAVREGVIGATLAERTTHKEAPVANQISGEFPMNPTRILRDLHDHIPANSFVVTNVGWNENGLARQYDISMPGTLITLDGSVTMGFGSPAALGM